jgi:DNA-binding CsgD family transcriptional regulator
MSIMLERENAMLIADEQALLDAASSWQFLTGDLALAIEQGRMAVAAAHAGLIEPELWTRFFSVAAGLRHTDYGWRDLAEIRDHAMAAGHVEAAARMAVAQACLATFRLDPVRAVPLLDTAIGLAAGRLAVALRGCLAYAMLHGGDWDEAERAAALVLAEPDLPAMARVVPMSVLGLLSARRGRCVASTILDGARALFEPDLPRPGPPRAALAEVAWLAGDDPGAIARRPSAEAWQAADPWQAGALASWALRAGAPMPAIALAKPFALELTGDWAGAAVAFDRRGLPYEAALSRLNGDVDAVRQALAVFTALGALPAADRARRRLRELGARRGSRPPRHTTRTNAFGLTSRQLEIARLLGEGLTNAEIATRLVISHYTVNHHVTAILAKLGVRNRAHAAVLVGQAVA